MTKPTFVIYLNNLLAYSLFRLLKSFLPRTNSQISNSILFINSGQIGDLIVSSILFENEELFSAKYDKMLILVKDDYLELFAAYHGIFLIEFYNYRKYKWNIFYKVKLLKKIQRVGFKYCFNLTAARGILNDEMALLSGAKEIIALNSDWKYLKKIFGEKMDSFYTSIIGKDTFNEYEKHYDVLRYLLSNPIISFTSYGNNILFDPKRRVEKIINATQNKKKLVVIAPFSSDSSRDWPKEKLSVLMVVLINAGFEIILLGSKAQESKLKLICGNVKHVLVLAGDLELNEIPVLLTFASIFIGLDSGLTHIALKLKVATVAIIGGGMHGKFLPSPASNERVKYLFDECNYFRCEWRCRYSEKICINNISVDQIYNAILCLVRTK